jgi:hypothetical protein
MPHYAFIDGVAIINAVNLAAHCTGIDAEGRTRTVEDGPVMGQIDVKFLATIKETGPIMVRFKQDFAAAQVHATLWPLWNGKTAFTYILQPTSAVAGATNPHFTGTGIITRYAPIKGNFGDVPEVEIEITPAGTTPGLTEDITP